MLTAIRITADTLSKLVIREEAGMVHLGVTAGARMSESLRRYRHFPAMVVSMFAVGEASGRIGAVAKGVTDAYDVEVDRAVKP